MIRATALVATAVLALSRPVAAQTYTPPVHPYFEYQVEVPAKFIGDTAARPRPKTVTRADDPSQVERMVIVAFIVDSLGVIERNTIKILKSPSREATATAVAAIPGWKYSPALIGGFPVTQLVQTTVEP